MKRLVTIVLAIAGIGWLGYQIAMSTEAGQNFLLDRAFKPVSYTHLTLPTICSV